MSFVKNKPVPDCYAQNVVVYCRYSSDKQTENSIDGQLRACREYAERHGYIIIKEYIDRAMSGTSDDRPEFQRMIQDSKKQLFAFILVYRFDRFARNRYDSAIYKKQLEKIGIRVISVSEPIAEGEEGQILEAIYEAMDEAYSRRLSKITKRGMAETARKGLWTGGHVPFGYKIENQALTIDDETAHVVRSIFERYINGETKTQIADAVNAMGYHTTFGKDWNCNNITGVLRNRVYVGDYTYHSGEIQRSCPQLIDTDLFNKVQKKEIANRNLRGQKRDRMEFLLTGKLFCGMCGTAMTGDGGTSRSGRHYGYYSCGKHKRTHDCDKKAERKDYLEWYVCEQTVQNILTPENIKKIASNVEAIAKKELEDGETERLRKLAEDLDRQMDKLVDSFINAPNEAVRKKIGEKTDDLNKQIETVRADLLKMELRDDMTIKAEDVERYLQKFQNGDFLDESFQRRVINTLINAVYIWDDKLVIYYNLKGTKQVCYFDMISDLDELVAYDGCSDSMVQGEPIIHQSEQLIFFSSATFGLFVSKR